MKPLKEINYFKTLFIIKIKVVRQIFHEGNYKL